MSDERKSIQSRIKQQKEKDPGFFAGLANQIKLILRLIGDKRVNPLLKLLPIGSLVYLVVPDLIPFIVDDALVIGLGTYFFIELCPQEIVDEHKAALQGRLVSNLNLDEEAEEVIDGEVIDIDENK